MSPTQIITPYSNKRGQGTPRGYYQQGFSRVMTKPAGRGRRCSKSHGSGRVGLGRVGSVGSRGFEISRFGSGRVKEALKYHASDRVGSRGFEISRVGSDRVATREIRVTSRVRPQ